MSDFANWKVKKVFARPTRWMGQVEVAKIEGDGIQEVTVLSTSNADQQNAANLIAAAPDLYKALEDLFASYKELADSGDAGFWRLEDKTAGMRALAALAKARGEA